MASLNNTPPVLPYVLAAALGPAGGGEFWTRALLFPFDLAAAWGLLALAARFLKRPLWPTLVVLAGPAWALNMPHAMAERVMAGFAFPALWLAVVAADEGDARAFWGAAALAALALLSKYNALFVLPPALLYLRSRGTPPPRLAAWAAVAVSGLAAFFLASAAGGSAAAVLSAASAGPWSAPTHKLRSLLAFTGGLSFAAAAWGARLSPSRRAVLIAGVACAFLFAPWFDLAPLVRGVDRATGFLLAWGTCVGLWTLAGGPRARGAALWGAWAASVAALQLAYWCVLARFVVFLIPPLTFWLWERLEAERPNRLDLLGAATLAATLALSLACGAVDRTYAVAQKTAAFDAARGLGPGATLWCAGHWGLQEYVFQAGGRELDRDRGGWDEVKPGDRVLASRVNANVLRPSRPLRASAATLTVRSWIPLRLMSGWTGEGGFYSNVLGFLPWSLSAEPVDEITTVDAL